MSNNYNFVREIKRKVPTGPNPEQSPESPPSMQRSYVYDFIREIKRKVPTGPNQ
ncbi:hypothetical protein RYX36_020073 [Vicia faba]